MFRPATSTCLVIAVMLSGAGAQSPAPPGDQQYLFIDAQSTRSKLTRTINLSKVRDRFMDAVSKGYDVQFLAEFSSSVDLLLRRGGAGAGSHHMVVTSREGAFLNELNQAASQGFRVVPEGIKAFEEGGSFGDQTTWIAVLMKQPDAPRIKYSVVKGTKEGEEALANSAAAGRALVGILGRQGMVAANTLLFFEEREARTGVPPVAEERQYRIIATARTDAMQKDLTKAAAERFQVIGVGFGYMTVVLARERGSAVTPIEHRVIAMIRSETAISEVQAAGAEGFRVTAISEHGQEGVFVLSRRPATSERFDYQFVRLQESTANQTLVDAETDGYCMIRLLNDLIVLERQSASVSTETRPCGGAQAAAPRLIDEASASRVRGVVASLALPPNIRMDPARHDSWGRAAHSAR